MDKLAFQRLKAYIDAPVDLGDSNSKGNIIALDRDLCETLTI